MTFGGAVFCAADFFTGHGTLAETIGTVEGVVEGVVAVFGFVADTDSETALGVVLLVVKGDEGAGELFILTPKALNAAADIVLTTFPSFLISFICSAETLLKTGR